MTYLEKIEWFKKEYDSRKFPNIPARLNWLWIFTCYLFTFGNIPEDKVNNALQASDDEQKKFLANQAEDMPEERYIN